MTHAEFTRWFNDFSSKFPDTSQWVESRGALTTWFSDCFSSLDLEDCLAVTRNLFREGGIEAYARERVPAHYLKHAGEMRWKREQAARQREEQLNRAKRVSAHAVMREQSMRWAFVQSCRFKNHVDRVKWIAQYFDNPNPIMTADEFVSDTSKLKDAAPMPDVLVKVV